MDESKKKKIIKRNIILFAVFIVLLLYVLIYNFISDSNKKKKNKLINFVIGDIKSLIINNDKGMFAFEREGSIWRFSSITNIDIDKQQIDGFLDDVRNIKIKREIGEKLNLDDFGLENKNIYIKLVMNNCKTNIIYLGNQTDSKIGHYVLFKNKIYIIDKDNKDFFHKDLFYFRNKRIFNVVEREINYLKIKWKNKTVKLAKTALTNGKKVWIMKYPYKKRLEIEKVNTFLFELEALETKKFIEGKKLNLEYFGVPSDNYILFKTVNNKFYKCYIGKKTDDGYYFFVDKRQNVVYIIDDYFVEDSISDYIMDILKKEEGEKNETKQN